MSNELGIRIAGNSYCAGIGIGGIALYCGMDLRPTSGGARFPAPVAAKSSAMPAHQRLGTHDCYDLEDRWEPTIKLDEEQPIVAGKPNAPMDLAPQYDELLPQRSILGSKLTLRLESSGHKVQGRED
jgi:hypothetical protein